MFEVRDFGFEPTLKLFNVQTISYRPHFIFNNLYSAICLLFFYFTVNPCRLCGLPLCPDCAKMGSPKYHGIECKLFETCGMYKSNPVTTYKQAKTIYMYLTPLRLLLKSENNPELMKLSSKLEDRENTLIYFLNAAHVVKPMCKLLGLETRFSELQIQVKNPFTTYYC